MKWKYVLKILLLISSIATLMASGYYAIKIVEDNREMKENVPIKDSPIEIAEEFKRKPHEQRKQKE